MCTIYAEPVYMLDDAGYWLTVEGSLHTTLQLGSFLLVSSQGTWCNLQLLRPQYTVVFTELILCNVFKCNFINFHNLIKSSIGHVQCRVISGHHCNCIGKYVTCRNLKIN